MKKILSFAVVSLLIFVSAGFCDDKITEINICSDEWKNATNNDGTGIYWEIFRAVYEPVGIKVNTTSRSYSGTVEMVKKKTHDALVGSYLNEIEGVIYPKQRFGADIVAAFFKKENAGSWKGEESLKDKKVAWIKGYSFDEYLSVPVHKMEYDKRKTIIKLLLEHNKVDYFLDALSDLKGEIEEEKINEELYSIEIVKKLDLYLAFADSERGKKLAGIFDERFPELVKSGEIKKIYDKWSKSNIPYPF